MSTAQNERFFEKMRDLLLRKLQEINPTALEDLPLDPWSVDPAFLVKRIGDGIHPKHFSGETGEWRVNPVRSLVARNSTVPELVFDFQNVFPEVGSFVDTLPSEFGYLDPGPPEMRSGDTILVPISVNNMKNHRQKEIRALENVLFVLEKFMDVYLDSKRKREDEGEKKQK